MSKKLKSSYISLGALTLVAGLMPFSAHACFTGGGGCGGGCGGGSDIYACLDFNFKDKTSTSDSYDPDNNAGTNNNVTVNANALSAWSSDGAPLGSGNLESATLSTNQYGLLVYSNSNDSHYIDNKNSTDSVLFNFSQSLYLTSLETGLASGDSDFAVYAWMGGPGDPTALAGTLYSTNTSATTGWRLVGNYAGASSASTYCINGASLVSGECIKNDVTSVSSSYWLIGAYNGGGSGANLGTGNDYFKLLALGAACPVTPPPPGVPEPGTLLLMGAGLLGLTRYNKRRTQV